MVNDLFKYKFIGTIFVVAFFLVNFFNILPIQLNSYSWYLNVSLLIVDTSSLLLIGMAIIYLVNRQLILYVENLFSVFEDTGNFDYRSFILKIKFPINNLSKEDQKYYLNYILERLNSNFANLKRFLFLLVVSYLLIFIFQIPIAFQGINQIEKLSIIQTENINNRFIESKKLFQDQLLRMNTNENSSESDRKILNNVIKNLELRKKDSQENIKKTNAKNIFNLIKNIFKVILMSILWAISFYLLLKL